MTARSLVSGALNFRDVGGLPAGDRVTRTGTLFRSGNLANVDESGAADLRRLGLRRIIDLRDDNEVRYAPSRVEGLGVQTQRVPLYVGSIESFFQSDAPLDAFYREIVEDAADRVAEVVRGILVDQPVLVHCTAGKDRTGITVALTLAAAGVDDEAVIADYARTEAMLPESRNRAVLARLRQLHPDARHVEEVATRSPAPVMRALLADLTARYGGVSEYLRAQGVTDDELAELRRVLLATPG